MSTKLLNDLITDLPNHHPKVADRISGLVTTIADRIADCGTDGVKLSDLVSVLRQDPDQVATSVVTNPPERDPAPIAADAPKEGMQAQSGAGDAPGPLDPAAGNVGKPAPVAPIAATTGTVQPAAPKA